MIAALKELYDDSADGVLVANGQSQRFLYANRAICEMLGYAEAELCALSVTAIHPRDALPEVLGQFDGMREQRVKYAADVPCLRKDGSVFYADISAHHAACRQQPCMVGVFRDVSEQRLAGEMLRMQRDLAVALSATSDLATALGRILDTTMQIPRIDCGGVYLVDARTGSLDLKVHRGLSGQFVAGVSHIEADSPQARLVQTGKPYYNRVGNFEPVSDSVNRAEGLLAVAVIPILYDGELIAALNLASRSHDEMPTAARHVMEAIGALVGGVIARVEVETLLRESEHRYRLIADNVTDVIFTTRLADIVEPAMLAAANDPADLADVVLGDRWRFTYVSPSVQRLTGYSAEEMATLPLRRLLTPESFAYLRNLLRVEFSYLNGRTAELPPRYTFEVEIVAKDGPRRWCEVAITFLRNDEKEHVGTVGVVRDITERREAAEAVQKEQALLRRLLDLHERERQLAAYEIHDGFTQHLAGALLLLQGFRENFSRSPVEAWKTFDTAAKWIAQAIDDARRLISGLRPPILDEAGIVDAVDYLVCENQCDDGPTIEFTHDVAFDRLAPPLETAIFRIVQESLRNACRHSRSARISVELVQRDQTVYLEVRDWGIGFDPSRAAEQRFGLQGIRERVRLLGGRIAIESAPGEGTRIYIELPIVVPDS